jgi:type I restriction enzyme S subunit
MPRRSIALDQWDRAGRVTSTKQRFSRGNCLFGKLRPYFHKVGIAPIDGICSTDIVVLTASEPHLAAYVLACIAQNAFVAFTDRTSTGTKMPRTSWSLMSRYPVTLPARPVLDAFQRTVEPIVKMILANISEARTLAATRDLLLPRLMSGEIRIRDVDVAVQEAARA